MRVRKNHLFSACLPTICVAAICIFSLLSAGTNLEVMPLQAYAILPRELTSNIENARAESVVPAVDNEFPLPSESSRPQLPSDAPDYMRLYPEMYGPGSLPGSETSREMTLYLTFDDGPSENTSAILEILDYYGIKATFFVVPNESQSCIDRLREIHDRGHTIGVHSRSHDYETIYKDVESYLHDFSEAYEIIFEATGEYPSLFRFPGGSINSYNRKTSAEIIQEMERRGFVYFDWNISAQDAQNGITSDEVYQNVISTLGAKKSGVILMHDSKARGTTVEALPRIIETLLSAGFQFDRLDSDVYPVQF